MGERGWGAGGKNIMRLQMHATDPDFLEKRRVLRGDRTPVATAGRYLVIVDTQRAAPPAWARRP